MLLVFIRPEGQLPFEFAPDQEKVGDGLNENGKSRKDPDLANRKMGGLRKNQHGNGEEHETKRRAEQRRKRVAHALEHAGGGEDHGRGNEGK